MKSIITLDVLVPILIIFLSILIVISFGIWLLKKRQLLKTPYGGMEWSELIYTASILFGLLLITTTLIEPVFHTYKTLASNNLDFRDLVFELFQRSAQYFLVSFISIIIYLIFIIIIAKKFSEKKNIDDEIINGNLPVAALISVMIIGFSLVFKQIDDQLLDSLIPYIMNFR